VLAGKSNELIALGALRNLDTVLVGPLLDLRVGPGVEKSIAQALLGGGGGRRNLSVGALGVLASKTRLPAEAGNEGVAGGGLGNVVAALIEPRLEVRVRPRSVEPVTRVVSSLGSLVGNGLVVLADRLQERVTLAGLGNGNAVLVGESLELRVGPSVDSQYMPSTRAICNAYESKIQSLTLL
jgi:hypothetical protein